MATRRSDVAPEALAASTAADAVLTEARRRLAACDRTLLRTSDIVHGDFAPENLLDVRDWASGWGAHGWVMRGST